MSSTTQSKKKESKKPKPVVNEIITKSFGELADLMRAIESHLQDRDDQIGIRSEEFIQLLTTLSRDGPMMELLKRAMQHYDSPVHKIVSTYTDSMDPSITQTDAVKLYRGGVTGVNWANAVYMDHYKSKMNFYWTKKGCNCDRFVDYEGKCIATWDDWAKTKSKEPRYAAVRRLAKMQDDFVEKTRSAKLKAEPCWAKSQESMIYVLLITLADKTRWYAGKAKQGCDRWNLGGTAHLANVRNLLNPDKTFGAQAVDEALATANPEDVYLFVVNNAKPGNEATVQTKLSGLDIPDVEMEELNQKTGDSV